MTNSVEVHWQKIKFKHLGEQGVSNLEYNFNNGRFDPDGHFDNTDWIGSNEIIHQVIEPNIDFYEKQNNDAPF